MFHGRLIISLYFFLVYEKVSKINKKISFSFWGFWYIIYACYYIYTYYISAYIIYMFLHSAPFFWSLYEISFLYDRPVTQARWSICKGFCKASKISVTSNKSTPFIRSQMLPRNFPLPSGCCSLLVPSTMCRVYNFYVPLLSYNSNVRTL